MDSYDHPENIERDSYLDHDDDSSDDEYKEKECDNDDEVEENDNIVVLTDEEEEQDVGEQKIDYFKRFKYEMLLEMHVEEEIGIEAAIAIIYIGGGSPPMNIDEFLTEGMDAYTAALMTVLLGIPIIVSIKDKLFIDLSMYYIWSVIACIKYKYKFCLIAGSNYNTKILSKYFPILFSNIMDSKKSQLEWYEEEVEEMEQVRKKFGWNTPNVGSELLNYSIKCKGRRGYNGESIRVPSAD